MQLQRRFLTLIEVMVVIVIIGLISGVLAYNLRGSLNEGKRFKTEHGREKVYNILMLEVAKGASIDEVASNWKDFLAKSPLTNKPKDLLHDGWGAPYKVQKSSDGTDLEVSSSNLQ